VVPANSGNMSFVGELGRGLIGSESENEMLRRFVGRPRISEESGFGQTLLLTPP